MTETVSLSWTDRRHIERVARSAGTQDWRTHAELGTIAQSAWETSQETRRARHAMESVGYAVDAVADRVAGLEREVGIRLEEQTRALQQQSEILSQIRDAVLTPAKTRAAERVADAAQLLDRERWDRALAVAEEGIDADPNNPGVFFAAGWALVGLERPDEARSMFEEARDAADGDQRSLGARQAARAALAGGDSALAFTLARDARAMAESPNEAAAVAYDVAVYAWLNEDRDTARQALLSACEHDSRYCEMALLDRNLDDASELRDLAATTLATLSEEVGSRLPEVERRSQSIRDSLPAPPTSARTYSDLAPNLRPDIDWSVQRSKVKQGLAKVDHTVAGLDEEDTIQGRIAALAASSEALDVIEGEARDLPDVIAAHDAASKRQDELEALRAAAEGERDKWQSIAANTQHWRANAGKWLFWSVATTALGLALPIFLAIGLPMLLVTLGALALDQVARQRRTHSDGVVQRTTTEMSGNRGAEQ